MRPQSHDQKIAVWIRPLSILVSLLTIVVLSWVNGIGEQQEFGWIVLSMFFMSMGFWAVKSGYLALGRRASLLEGRSARIVGLFLAILGVLLYWYFFLYLRVVAK